MIARRGWMLLLVLGGCYDFEKFGERPDGTVIVDASATADAALALDLAPTDAALSCGSPIDDSANLLGADHSHWTVDPSGWLPTAAASSVAMSTPACFFDTSLRICGPASAGALSAYDDFVTTLPAGHYTFTTWSKHSNPTLDFSYETVFIAADGGGFNSKDSLHSPAASTGWNELVLSFDLAVPDAVTLRLYNVTYNNDAIGSSDCLDVNYARLVAD